MIGRLRKFFEDLQSAPPESEVSGTEPVRLAAAFLLIEAANLDGHYSEAERATVEGLLSRRFGLDAETCAELLAEAEQAQAHAVQWQRYTRAIVEHFDERQRIEMIEMLWEVVHADGRPDDYEANLLRRIGGLIYVSDRERGAARKRVVERLGLG